MSKGHIEEYNQDFPGKRGMELNALARNTSPDSKPKAFDPKEQELLEAKQLVQNIVQQLKKEHPDKSQREIADLAKKEVPKGLWRLLPISSILILILAACANAAPTPEASASSPNKTHPTSYAEVSYDASITANHMAYDSMRETLQPKEPTEGETDETKIVEPVEVNKNKVDESTIQLFKSVELMKEKLLSANGAQWVEGDAETEIANFPWKHSETWNMFAKLESVGNKQYHVYLLSDETKSKFTLIGIESVGGKTIINYVGRDGKSNSVALEKTNGVKQILGNSYVNMWDKFITVWPNMRYESGECPSQLVQAPTSGLTEGFACSPDGLSGHYFIAQSTLIDD